MGHDRRTDPESQDRRWYEQGDHAEADNQVLPDDPAGAAAQPYGKRKMRKVVGHERTVGGLERNVRPGGAHGETYRPLRDSGRNVDTVPPERKNEVDANSG